MRIEPDYHEKSRRVSPPGSSYALVRSSRSQAPEQPSWDRDYGRLTLYDRGLLGRILVGLERGQRIACQSISVRSP